MMAPPPAEVPSSMMAAPPPPEFTIICIDNGERALCCQAIYDAQLKGARYFCETLLKFSPGSLISIFTMSSKSDVKLVDPTNDLWKLMRALEYVPCHLDGETDVQHALARACLTFSQGPSKMKKRLIMFVGSTINLQLREAYFYGKKLKENSVALDVFNFCYLRGPLVALYDKARMFQGTYHYARKELETLVSNVNYKGNSRMEDIVEKYESSVLGTLKERLRYLEKKAAADVENNKSDVDKKNKTAAR